MERVCTACGCIEPQEMLWAIFIVKYWEIHCCVCRDWNLGWWRKVWPWISRSRWRESTELPPAALQRWPSHLWRATERQSPNLLHEPHEWAGAHCHRHCVTPVSQCSNLQRQACSQFFKNYCEDSLSSVWIWQAPSRSWFFFLFLEPAVKL